METFIDYKGMLLLRHEWAGGERPSDKILAARLKLAKKNPGEVRVITDERDFETSEPKQRILRKP